VVTERGAGSLFIVSTPIGNMGDFSFRAIEVLKSVAVILAEDTRHSKRLLDHFEIATPMLSHHEHNEAKSTPAVIARLERGESVALISDAGTPLLSDPGARLVAAAIDAGVPVVPVPGASALLAALVASGLPAEPFTFFGFLARKGGDRARQLAAIAALEHTAVVYEAPGRVGATLADLAREAGADRATCVARELTKKFEEVRRGTLAELATYYEESSPRGEVVIIVGGAAAREVDTASLEDIARELRSSGLSSRDIVSTLATKHGASRNQAYRLVHGEGSSSSEES
jgi:16S rRNA (cytidine1402-2'-O)-methyltransferase